jgi:ClpP class serine protease
VRERRGDKLDGSAELFDGEVWIGEEAVRLGLVDGLGTLREIVTKRYPDAEISTVEGRKPLLARLGLSPAASRGDVLSAALDTLENRALWSRFGL